MLSRVGITVALIRASDGLPSPDDAITDITLRDFF